MYIIYKSKRFEIIGNKIVPTIGDIDMINQVAYVDKRIDKQYHRGIAIHEAAEREGLCMGLSNTAAHARANRIEYEYYARKMGDRKAKHFIVHEELSIPSVKNARFTSLEFPYCSKRKSRLRYLDKHWQLQPGNEERTGIDIYPRDKILLVNPRVPIKLRPILGVYTIEERRKSEEGKRYSEADKLAWKAATQFARSVADVKTAKKWVDNFYRWGLYRWKTIMASTSDVDALFKFMTNSTSAR